MKPEEWLLRQSLLLGEEATRRLLNATVVVVGLGGVGSYAVEGLTRAGCGSLVLVDHDRFEITNLNRQLYATNQTLDRLKTEVACERVKSINRDCCVTPLDVFFSSDTASQVLDGGPDYVIDAIDTVSSKADLIVACQGRSVPVVSVLGTGNRLDPLGFEVTDISRTHTCALARALRRELRDRGVTEGVEVVFSGERPFRVDDTEADKRIPGTISAVPAVAGLVAASVVVRRLAQV